MKLSGFVITLERAVERRPHMEWILANAPITCAPLSAVDGVALSEAEVSAIYHRQLYSPRYPHLLRRGEIGCFLSHRKAWQEIVNQGLDAAMILEDDVTFAPSELNAMIEFLTTHIQPNDYMQLQAREIAGNSPRLVQSGRHSIVKPTPVILRTTAQVVTREAAMRLLKVSEQFDRPVDAFLQMTWVTGVPVKVALPRVIEEVSAQLGGSTLGGRQKQWFERMSREILRPIYRARINLRSRRAS